MKKIPIIRIATVLLCGSVQASSIGTTEAGASEFQKAAEYIENKGGEVYIAFPRSGAPRPGGMNLSIAGMNDREIFAYLNKREFKEFLAAGIPYRVLPHPGDLLPNPCMSDYSGDTYRIDKYPTYEGYLKIMADFETNHPAFCKIHTVGESVQGRKLLAAKISDSVNTREKEPRYYMSATIHGDETAGYIAALELIDYLLKNHDRDARIKRIVDSTEVWICPLMNPDGTYCSGDGTVSGARRNNANDQDLNRDFPDPVTGPYPNGTRQKETEQFLAFEQEYDFTMTSDLHGGAEVACYPWGCNWSKIAADDQWWKLISRNYASTAQKNGPEGYFAAFNNGIVNGCEWYGVTGGRMSYALYFRHNRLLTLEISATKLLPDSLFDNFWNYNRDALLGHIEEVFNGIRGTVTDTLNGKGIRAKVVLKNFDKDSSFVYGMTPHGDFYRPAFKGAYDVEVFHAAYHTKVIPGVKVENGKATVLDIKLRPLNYGTCNGAAKPEGGIVLRIHNGAVVIYCPGITRIESAAIYSLDGATIERLNTDHFPQSKTIEWNGKYRSTAGTPAGGYIAAIHTPGATKTFRFFFPRR